MLIEIRRFLAERRRATLAEIALHLGVAPDAARGMMAQWQRRGKARLLPSPCGGCGIACTCAAPPEIYEWIG